MENELISYAYEQFESGTYDKALEAFVASYQKGYEQEWVLENIYNCYMIGNENLFQQTYMQQAPDAKITYDECLLDFIPYRDGEYFIFDKEKRIFLGIFSIPVLKGTKPDSIFNEIEYSAVALALNWDFREKSDILTKANERKIYIVCHDARRCMSFWKIPEMIEYLEQIVIFYNFIEYQEYFHKNTSVYLPMIIRGIEEDSKILEKIREEEHQYRLTPEGRNTENVLLSIAIPTANRGNLILKRLENLLSMPYDAEIEISVSKNGSEKYEEEYKQASMITDARLHYYDHGKVLLTHQSFHYAIKMCCGKYVLLVSDEDDVIISALEHYLKVLDSQPETSVIRVRSKNYSSITDRIFEKRGLKAFKLMFLGQNYISGIMVRRKDFTDDDFLNDAEILADNIFYRYYPHECWAAELCKRGDALIENVYLINEGKSVLGDNFFPEYALYQERINQLKGMIEFIRFIMRDDIEGAQIGLLEIISKTGFLLKLTRKLGPKSDKYLNTVDEATFICIEAIESFPFNDNQKLKLFRLLEYCYIDLYAFENNMNNEK